MPYERNGVEFVFEGFADDSTNNLPLFAEAINRLADVAAKTGQPGTLTIPPGIFRITGGPISVKTSNICIRGAGRFSTTIKQMTLIGAAGSAANQQGFPCIEIRGTQALSGVTWTDLAIGGFIVYGGQNAVALSNPLIVTSSNRPFTNSDEGTVIQITGGTGWNTGYYTISHVDQYANAFLAVHAANAQQVALPASTGGLGSQWSGKLANCTVRDIGFVGGYTPFSLGASSGVDGRPTRDYAAGVYVVNADRTLVENISCNGTITGVKLRGNSLSNSQTGNGLLDYDNIVRDGFFTNVDFGLLLEQQGRTRITGLRSVGVNATQLGGTGGWEPPHTIYTTGPNSFPFSRSYNITIDDCSTFGNLFQSAYKFKHLTGCTITNLVADYCERGFDIESNFNCCFSNCTVRNMAPSTPYVVQQQVVGVGTGTVSAGNDLSDTSYNFRGGDAGANDIWIFPAGTTNVGGQLVPPTGQVATKYTTDTSAAYPSIHLLNGPGASSNVTWALVASNVVFPDSQQAAYNITVTDECTFTGLLADVTGADSCPGFIIRTSDFGTNLGAPVFTQPPIASVSATGPVALGPLQGWTANGQGFRSMPAVTVYDNVSTGVPGSGATAILQGRSFNDLTCTGNATTPPTIASAANPFTSLDVGNTINITSGTAFSAGAYRIVAVDGSGNATVDVTAASGAGAGSVGIGYLAGWDAVTQQVYGVVITNGGSAYTTPAVQVGGSCNDNQFNGCSVAAAYSNANTKQAFRVSGAQRQSFVNCKVTLKSGGDNSTNAFSLGNAGGNVDYRSGGLGPAIVTQDCSIVNPTVAQGLLTSGLVNISAGVLGARVILNRDLLQGPTDNTSAMVGDSGTNSSISTVGQGFANSSSFQSGATDYKMTSATKPQSLTAHVTNLAVDATVLKKVTTATRSFTAADIGMGISVTAGAGWTVGLYYVVSVSGTAAILDRSPAVLGTTGGTADLMQRPFTVADIGRSWTPTLAIGSTAGPYRINAVDATYIATLDRTPAVSGQVNIAGSVSGLQEQFVSQLSASATPSVKDGRAFYRTASTASITSLTGAMVGQTVTLICPPQDVTTSLLAQANNNILTMTDIINGPNNTASSVASVFTAAMVGRYLTMGGAAGTGFTNNGVYEITKLSSYTAHSYTDLATDSTGLNCTSTAFPFAAADVGRNLPITAGTGWTAGVYQVIAVNGTTAVLDRSGGASATGGTAASVATQVTLGTSLGTLGTTLNNSGTGNVGGTLLLNGNWGPFALGSTATGHTITLRCTNRTAPMWTEVGRS